MIKDYNDVDWKNYVYYSENSPTFLRYVYGNNIKNQNQKFKDDIAGNKNKKYSQVKYKNKNWLVHRIVWILHNGYIPDNFVINHKDFNTHNNSIANLESCSFRENLCRTQIGKKLKLSTRNTSGVNAVSECTKHNGYKTYVYARVGWVNLSGIKKEKLFSYSIFGKEKAWELAISFRAKLELEGFILK